MLRLCVCAICAHACACPCAQNSFIECVPFPPFQSCRRWCWQTLKTKYARFCLRICVATGIMSSHVGMEHVDMPRTYSNVFPRGHVSTCARTLHTREPKLKCLRTTRWVPLKTIGGWFNTTPDVREALSIIKEKHKQVRSERPIPC